MIEIISASAGSGKTFRLAELLKKSLGDKEVRPDAIIATTFTRKAAAELREKTRRALLEAGLAAEAQRLQASRIGTVNSVCGQLVEDFAYDLGLPPRLRVIEEDAASELLRGALEEARDPEDLRGLSDCLARFDGDFDVDAQIKSIMDLARTNQLVEADLASCADRSLAGFLGLLDPVPQGEDGSGLNDSLRQATLRALDNCSRDKVNKTFQSTYDLCTQVLGAFAGGRPVRWNDWLKLSKGGSAGKSAQGAFDALPAIAGNFLRHPQFRHDIEAVTRRCYGIAGRALSLFQERKRELGVIDFVDQETYALKLLGLPAVVERLRGEIDLFLVDEFQDTSPLQLAIFMRLAQIARRSVWVGDQKQSIFAFRGTDPALMDAAMEAILKRGAPDTLRFSWRSRKDLVRLTSEVFAPSFTTQDIPEERTRLESKVEEKKSDELGCCVEVWDFQGSSPRMNIEEDARCLASGVAALLADKTARVRSRDGGSARSAEPHDVAVLCRTNEDVIRLARELAALGIDVALGRPGLLGTVEGILMRAALALWVNQRDTLAAAQVARILHSDPAGEEWFREALDGGEEKAFLDKPTVQRIVAAKEAQPLVGPVAAFDVLCGALDLPRLVLRWPDPPQRFANLEVFRRHLLQYAEACAQEGYAATPAGALQHLSSLAENEDDAQGLGSDRNAVTLSTWHRAKGLEWPITILSGLHKGARSSPFGVQVEAAKGGFRVDDPLAGRWIRFWPNPFNPGASSSVFHDRAVDSPEAREAHRQAERQELRLMYVGWTRARDRVVLAGRPEGTTGSFWGNGMLAILERHGKLALKCPSGTQLSWAGVKLDVVRRTPTPRGPVAATRKPAVALKPSGPQPYPPARMQPSSSGAVGRVLGEEILYQRLRFTGKAEIGPFGEALHRFLASDLTYASTADRTAMALRVLEGFGVPGSLPPEDLATASDALQKWIAGRYPGAAVHHELPLQQPLPDGSLLVGRADLVIETEASLILIDHKSYPGARDAGREHAASYGGQLAAYAAALEAAMGKPVVERWINLVVLGMMVRVD